MSNATEQIFLPSSSGTQAPAALQKPAHPPPVVNLENVEEFSNVCRVCAASTALVLPIFSGEGLENNLADKINKYLPIKVSASDSPALPVVVCYQCASTLLAAHELAQCSAQADAALRTRSAVLRARRLQHQKSKPSLTTPSSNSNQPSRSDQELSQSTNEPSSRNNDSGTTPCKPDGTDEWHPCGSFQDDDRSCDEDDRPLATIASERTNEAYHAFYTALLNFRNHFLEEHDTKTCSYPDFTESSGRDSGDEATRAEADRYDDLSRCNMRRDRMDEATRRALALARTHVDGKLCYACGTCGRRLSSAHTFVLHARIHTGERPCVCHVCGKQFRAPGGLQRHVAETHERARRRACRLCARTFANSQNLKQHLRTHTGERPYACALCPKRFAQAGSLHAHRKTHSAALPHRCAHCPAAFRLRAGLARHRLRHSGERPHACAACARAFCTRADLLAHRAAHGAARPHACASCGAAFRSRRALRHHARRLHAPAAEPPPSDEHTVPANRSYFVLAPF